MASPITTGGFQVQAQPGIRLLAPEVFSSGAGNILPSVSRGLSLAGQLQQIQDEAQARPINRQLQQIKLQEAQARLAQLPIEQQLQQIAVGEAEKRAALPGIIPGDVTIEDTTKVYPTALDELGNRTGPDDVVPGDLVQITEEQVIGPGGVITPRQVRKTLKTAEQRAAEAEKQAATIRATDALAAQRGTPKAFEYDVLVQKRDQALQEGDEEAAALYENRLQRLSTLPSLIPTGTTYARQVEKMAAEAGVTLEQANKLSKTPEGMEALASAAASRKAAARGTFGPQELTSAQRTLLRPSVTSVVAPVEEIGEAEAITTTPPAVDILEAPVVVTSKAQRDALPIGTRYINPKGQISTKN